MKGNNLKTAAPRAVRVGALSTLAEVRAELGRLYRAARQSVGDKIDPRSAAQLASVLQMIGRSIEASEIEARLRALEKHIEEARQQ